MTVDRRHRLVLRVAFMAGVVAPAVTEVYAADESHVPFSSFSVADNDEFLVMRAAESHALVEKDLAPAELTSCPRCRFSLALKPSLSM